MHNLLPIRLYIYDFFRNVGMFFLEYPKSIEPIW